MLSRHLPSLIRPLLMAAALACAGPAAQADSATPSPQTTIRALAAAHAAVVGITASTESDAPSAQSLGNERKGSGVVIGDGGLILTIGYLTLDAERIEVTSQDGRALPARQVAYDLATGFGLVQTLVPLADVAPAVFGSIEGVAQGDVMMAAMGGSDGDVAMTRLVSKRAFSGYWEYHIDSALFTSPPIASHSGAPLFTQRGELVGIGSLFVGDALGGDRRLPGNMFVPVDLLKPILAEMRATGSSSRSHRPWIGMSSAEQSGRVQVIRINRDGPADTAGLRPGDVVLAVDGTKVATLADFYKKLWDRPAADAAVELTVLQGAEVKTVTVQAVDRMNTLRKPSGI